MATSVSPRLSRQIAARCSVTQPEGAKPPRPQGPKVCLCGSKDCAWVVDPYVQDIDGVKQWEYLCDACYNSRCADV